MTGSGLGLIGMRERVALFGGVLRAGSAPRAVGGSWPGGWPHPGPCPRGLVLTTFDLDEYIHAALRAGASGFLLKNASPDQLCDAIRVVAVGEAVLAPAVTRRLIGTLTAIPPALLARPEPPDGAGSLESLTTRELEVLVLVARGLSNARIARNLQLSEAGVKRRVNRILTRLGLENRVQAAIVAREAGLLDGSWHGTGI